MRIQSQPASPRRKSDPARRFYSDELREFLLPYDHVRESNSPDDTLLDFLQTTYEAAANLGEWDRTSLERNGNSTSAIEPGFPKE